MFQQDLFVSATECILHNATQKSNVFYKIVIISLAKKMIFSVLKKMAINNVNWHFSLLLQSRAHFSLGIDAFSAEKIGATLRSAEKFGKTWRKLALFSAAAVVCTFFH